MELLNYAATYSNAKIRYYYSRIILHIYSNRSYLSVRCMYSRVGDFYFLSDNPNKPELAKINSAIYILYNILKILWDL